MSSPLGNDWGVFLGVTLVLMGGAGWMTGQALARTWRPIWQLIPYGLLLGFGDRFLVYALFDGELINAGAYVIDTVVIFVIGAVAFRRTQVAKMVDQYPWLYRRSGPFSWRNRQDGAE